MTGVAAPLITVHDNVTVVSLAGAEYENLDQCLLEGIRNSLLDVAQSADPPLMVLDLAHTKFFGSAFIEVLFRVATRLKNRNGQFALANLTEYCAEVIHVTHLDSLWPVVASTQEAIDKLKSTQVAS